MPVAGHGAFNVDEEAHHRAEHEDSRRWLQTADDGERHNENRREIKMQQHSKLINLPEEEHILQIRESSGHDEQHSRSFYETS